MNLVPKQVQADQEVISYWLKKIRWNKVEFACLFCAINPIAYEIFERRFLVKVDIAIEDEKIQEIQDLIRVIQDQIEFHLGMTNTPAGWKKLALELELPEPKWLEEISTVPRLNDYEFSQISEKKRSSNI